MSSTKKNFLYNSAYQLFIMLLPLITTPYIARVLGADGIGVYSYNHTIAQYFMIFIMLGLNNYGNRKVAQTRDNRKSLSKTFWTIYAMQIAAGVGVLSIYSVYCIFAAKNRHIACIMGLFVLSSCLDINWLYFGLEKFKYTTLRSFAIKLLSTLSIFTFVKQAEDVALYCLIYSGAALVSQVVLWIDVRKVVDWHKPIVKDVIVHVKPNMYLFITVIAVSLFKYMDKIMLGMFAGMQELGFYESSEKIIVIPTAFITALGTVMLPRMTNIIATRNKYDDQMLFRSMLFAMFFSSACCFGIMGISKEFVPLYYGGGYDICILLNIVLLPSCLFLAFANVIRTQYLLPKQMDKIYVGSAIVGAAVNLIFNLLLIPIWGCVGAAVGTLFAEFAVCMYQVIPVRKKLPIKKYIANSLPFLISGLCMFVVLYILELPINAILSVFAKVVIGAVIYLTTLLLQLLIFKNQLSDIWKIVLGVKLKINKR